MFFASSSSFPSPLLPLLAFAVRFFARSRFRHLSAKETRKFFKGEPLLISLRGGERGERDVPRTHSTFGERGETFRMRFMKFPFDESKLEKRSEIATLLKLKEGTCLVLPSCLPSFFLLFFTFSYFFKKYSPLDSHQSYPLMSSIISTSLLSKLLKTASFRKNRSMY